MANQVQPHPFDGRASDSLIEYQLVKHSGEVQNIVYVCTGRMTCDDMASIQLRLGLWQSVQGEWAWSYPVRDDRATIVRQCHYFGVASHGLNSSLSLNLNVLGPCAAEFIMLEATAGMRSASTCARLDKLDCVYLAKEAVLRDSVYYGPWSYEHYVRTEYGPLGYLLFKKSYVPIDALLPKCNFPPINGMPKVGGYLAWMLEELHGASLHARLQTVLDCVLDGTYDSLPEFECQSRLRELGSFDYDSKHSSRGHYLKERVTEVKPSSAGG